VIEASAFWPKVHGCPSRLTLYIGSMTYCVVTSWNPGFADQLDQVLCLNGVLFLSLGVRGDWHARLATRESCGLRLDFVEGHHSCLHVYVEMAVIHPGAWVVRDHVDGLHLGRREVNDVRAFAIMRHYVAVPVRRMEVSAFPHCVLRSVPDFA
jgi:hypothetical protein